MKRALFLDLDGTIIKTRSGNKFPKNDNDWKFNPGIKRRVKQYTDAGYVVVIVTNQAGIAYGYTTAEAVENKLKKIISELIDYTGCHHIYSEYCPESDSFYRKPNPGMGYSAAVAYEIDLSRSLMVGDASGKAESFSDSDREFAAKCNMFYEDIDDFLRTNYVLIDKEKRTVTT